MASPSKRAKTAAFDRPPIPNMNPSIDPVMFQQMDLSDYIGRPYPGMPGAQTGTVPIIRMFGITENGNSICCHVHGFTPYFYVSLPDTFTEDDLNPFKMKLNEMLMSDSSTRRENVTEAVLMVEIVMGKSLCNYTGNDDKQFGKITVALPKLIAASKRLLLANPGVCSATRFYDFRFYESNVDIQTRFLADMKIFGCSWLEIPAGKWYKRTSSGSFPITTRCQLELDVSVTEVIAHPPEGEWSRVAPFRILSFDIECAGRKGIFPEPTVDRVIQIANVLKLHGSNDVVGRNIFTLDTCAPIGNAEVHSFQAEEKMLNAWSEFIRKVDPDLITGYNINNFDLPYLFDRAAHLKLQNFVYVGRLLNVASSVKTETVQTKVGRRPVKTVNIDGRVIYDMLVVMNRNFKLRSYTLNNVSQEILGEQKEDVHYSIITDLQNGDEQTRRRLAVYCIKDAELPLKLMDHVKCFTNDIEMARVTGVPITSLLTKGEQVKVIAQLLRHARNANYFVPTHEGGAASDQYEGATVIEPKRGYYKDPIATLDFSSLYPSIMIAHNLCYTTLIAPNMKDKLGLTPEKVTTTPNGHAFVKASVRKGLLPQILEQLLTARKRAKTALKDETDPVMRAVLDGRQLALKISANSVYGFTGAQNGRLPCLEISGSVTAYGRSMIQQTKEEVEQHYCMKNNFEADAEVIYGDTDSVMVNFKVQSLERAMELGRQAAEQISGKFISPIKLEFEKVYYPYLLINKKRYAGLYFTKPDKYDKMDCKGIETVRRDNCTLVVDVISTCLEKLLIHKDPEGAVGYAKETIADLLQNKVDISQLVITKELTKEEYAAKQAHVVLSKKIAKRDPGNAPKLGDRIPYVIVTGAKNAPTYEKAEDPIYVLQNNIPIDSIYYLENQLSKPLVRIFEPILGDKAESELLRGDHTRTRTTMTSKVSALSAFTQKKQTCIGCRAVLRGEYESEAVCEYCKPKEATLYAQELSGYAQLESRYSSLYTECQRCQGSLHEEVLCTNRDCPIFYIRTKVQMELENAKTKIDRFGGAMCDEELC